MTADPVLSAALLGFVLGLQHATDPDHLVAVATIVTRERGFAAGAAVGVCWGLGHALTLTAAGLTIVALNLRLPTALETGFELAVAAVIVGLGVGRLADALRGRAAAGGWPVARDHDHCGRAALHRHPRWHLHPSRPLLRALAAPPLALAARAAAVGAVHGLAGTAAVSLLVLATLRSPAGAAAYLAVFAAGTLVGMVALTAAMSYPVALAARFAAARRALAFGSGLGAVVFGLVHAGRAL